MYLLWMNSFCFIYFQLAYQPDYCIFFFFYRLNVQTFLLLCIFRKESWSLGNRQRTLLGKGVGELLTVNSKVNLVPFAYLILPGHLECSQSLHFTTSAESIFNIVCIPETKIRETKFGHAVCGFKACSDFPNRHQYLMKHKSSICKPCLASTFHFL